MKVHWLIPLTVDSVLQFTSKNELARSFIRLGNELTTTVAYRRKRIPLDGFTEIEYIHTPSGSCLAKLRFHWGMFCSTLKQDRDVVMFGFGSSHLLPLTRLAWLGRRRPIFTMDIRTVPVDVSPGIKGKIERWRFDLAIRLCDLFCDGLTVITPALAESVTPSLMRLRNRIGVWTSGVQLDHFERGGPNKRSELGLEGKKVLFYHGVLSLNRGLQNALLAIDLLRDELPELVFLLVGDGPAKEELYSLANKLNLLDRVLFKGKVPYRSVADYVRTADCAILPFPNIDWWRVSSPIKLMEYLAIGVPIIATDIEAHRSVINQTGGAILAKNDQPESLAEAVCRAVSGGVQPVNRDLLEKTISWNSQARRLEVFLKRLAPTQDQSHGTTCAREWRL